MQHNLHKYLYAFIGASRVVSLISRADCITFCCLCCVAFAFAFAFAFTCTMITLNYNAHTLCVCEVVCVPPPVCVASGQHGAAHCWGVCILLYSSLLLNSPSCSHSPLRPFTCGFCSSRARRRGSSRRVAFVYFAYFSVYFGVRQWFARARPIRTRSSRLELIYCTLTLLYIPKLHVERWAHKRSDEMTNSSSRPILLFIVLRFYFKRTGPDRTEPNRFDSCFIARRVLCKLLTVIRVLRSRTHWIFGIHSFKRTLKIIYV